MIHKQKVMIEWVDWVGVILIVGAYVSVVFGVLNGTDWRYLVVNIVGSACVGYSSWRKRDSQPVVLNLIWIIVALLGLLQHHG